MPAPTRNPSLETNKTLRILNAASTSHFAVPGICCYNLEGVLATIRAAERLSSPALVLFFPFTLLHSGSILVRAAASACRSASVPVALHLDHAQDPALVRTAADIPDGFDSIMCDMSHFEKDENLRLTRELTNYCHQRGIATEAEPGRIEGGEDGVDETVDLEGVLTTVEQAREYRGTGVDMLAPAFGNVHGKYGARGIRLEYERLDRINQAVGAEVNLVLHGCDGFTDEIYRKCIDRGITKVNINGAINDEFVKVMGSSEDRALTSLITNGTDAMEKAVIESMIQLGSAGKAHLVQ